MIGADQPALVAHHLDPFEEFSSIDASDLNRRQPGRSSLCGTVRSVLKLPKSEFKNAA